MTDSVKVINNDQHILVIILYLYLLITHAFPLYFLLVTLGCARLVIFLGWSFVVCRFQGWRIGGLVFRLLSRP